MRIGRAVAAISLGAAAPAWADDPPPLLSAALRNTTDVWTIARGGLRGGVVVLNKLQVSGTFQGDRLGADGVSVHAQVFRTDGSSLSERIGDIQTADSLDARPVTRLFESWVEKRWGGEDRSLALRLGLMDLNSDFDSVQTASLFVNSSHGIGPDLSRSGLNGPSIYPVSAAGARLSWLPSKQWTFRLAAFDGVPGDPARPGAFVAVMLGRNDGALVIGQADYHLSDKAKVEAGAWAYTAASTSAASGAVGAHDQGAFLSVEGPLPRLVKWTGWVRLGVANQAAQAVSGYMGAGLVGQGLVSTRPEDRIGFAVARAGIGAPAQVAQGLPNAETSFEATYQIKMGDTFAVQPDAQYIVHPAGTGHVPDAIVLGVRLVLTAGYPRKAPATESSDPTVPPEGPQPTDDSGAGSSSHQTH